HAAAKLVANQLGGQFPRSAAALQELPGVGRYTAAAIASIAFDEPAAALDGNIKRVLARLVAVAGDISKPPVQADLQHPATELLPRAAPGDFNQALMDLGATICIPAKPRCLSCPVRMHCAAHATGQQDALPMKTRRAAIPTVYGAAAALIDARGRVLLTKRS